MDPDQDENPIGEEHTVTATVQQAGNPLPGVLVSFVVVAGPNVGEVSDNGECAANADCTTDGNGQVSWTYTSNGNTGTDIVVACFTSDEGNQQCDRVEKRWIDVTPPELACIETVNPHGKTIPPAGKTTLPGPKGGDNEDGFYRLWANDDHDGPVAIWVTDAVGSGPFGPFAPNDRVKITEAPGGTPVSKPIGSGNGQAGAVATHITLLSDAIIVATDAAGNQARLACLVPPPPK